MAFKFFRNGRKKLIAFVLLGIILLTLITAIIINQYWSPILAGKVKDEVAASSDGLYTIDFSSAELHVLRGSIVIYNIVFKTRYSRLQPEEETAPCHEQSS